MSAAVSPSPHGIMSQTAHNHSTSSAAMDERYAVVVRALTGGAAALADLSDSVSDASAALEAKEAFEQLSLGILFTIMLIFLGGTFFMTHKKRIPLPYTVVLFLYGIFVGAVAKLTAPEVATALGAIPPELLFYIFLPVLIFEGSFAMNIHALQRVAWQTLILASVGILINTALLGCAVKAVYASWSWPTALLLSCLLSATDPVAVVTLLKGLRVEKYITAMVDGEAVMNDGTAIIVFTLLLPAAKGGPMGSSVWLIILNCIRLSILPVALGPAFGFVQAFWLRRAKDGLTKACVTVSVTYVSYHVAAQWVGTSGVLTLFFQGVFLSYSCPSLFPGRERNLISSTWEFLVHLGNTVLFSLVGVILVADVVPTIEPTDIGIIVGLYIAMMVARLAMLEVLLPVLNMFSYRMDQKKVLLLTHAGLRGGVAATLALAVEQGGLAEGITILKITSGIVLLTLLVNASSAAYVVGLLGFKSKEEYQVEEIQHAMEYLYTIEEKSLERVKRDTKYRNADWLSVERYVSRWLRNPFAGMEILPDTEERVVNRLLMTSFKTSVWRQRDEQVISETVAVTLVQLVAHKIERGELFSIREMSFYHDATPPLGGGRRNGAVGHTASDVVVVNSTAARTPARSPAATARSSPQTLSVVVDVNREAARHSVEEELSPADAGVPTLQVKKAGAGDGADYRRGGSANTAAAVSFTAANAPEAPTEPSAAEEDSDAMVEMLMCRLLPAWARLAERFVFGSGYFVSAHRRAQENAFMTLLAIVKCFTSLSAVKYRYVKSPEQAKRVERWLSRQLSDSNAAVRFFYNHFPEATNTVSSSRAVISVVNDLQEAVEDLHEEYGLAMHVRDLLESMTDDIRENIPRQWANDAPARETDLVVQAVAATMLGKGLRRGEVRAIATMGLVKKFTEYDVITLPENAFLIVVFGSLRALHSPWTTINEHEWVESFGDTVGLETLLLPAELCKDQQRQWQVISTEATALLISFNSIRPFLSERSLRAVKALWRAAAVEVIMPLIELMLTPQSNGPESNREHFMSIVSQGTPLIGPEECAAFDYSSQFHLCFYLRGSDTSGFFNGHTPPCYISTFYATQLSWRDANVVLYAVPVNISDSGYVPWNLHAEPHAPPAEGGGSASDSDGDAPAAIDMTVSNASDSFASSVAALGSSPFDSPRPHQPHSAASASVPRAGSTYADAASMLNSVLLGRVPGSLALLRRELGPTAASDGVLGARQSEDRLATVSPLPRPRPGFGASAGGSPSTWRTADDSGLLLGSPTDGHHARAASTDSYEFLPVTLTSPKSMTVSAVCVLQRLSEFVTPVPYVNQLLGQYATVLEQLCIAVLRYMRYPDDALHVRHAQKTAELALEFLLSFAVELSLIRRAVKLIAIGEEAKRAAREAADGANAAREERGETPAAAAAPPNAAARLHELFLLDGEGHGEEVDAVFRCRVCAWSRQAARTKKYHLKTIILEMTTFANRRFRRYVAALKVAVQCQPALANVESVEGLQRLLSTHRTDPSQGGQ